MLIDVSDVSTIPVDVKEKIIDSFASLPSAVIDKIKSFEVESTNDIMCAIEDYYGPFKAFDFYDYLKIILELVKMRLMIRHFHLNLWVILFLRGEMLRTIYIVKNI